MTKSLSVSALGSLAAAFAITLLFPVIATAQDAPGEPKLPGLFTSIPYSGPLTASQIHARSRAKTTIPLWMGSASYKGTTYNYTMVGVDPAMGNSSKVPTLIIPIKFKFKTLGNAVSDPTKNDAGCLGGRNATDVALKSPIFKNITVNGIGTGQYASLFQRANYFTVNPNYSMTLAPVDVLPVQSVTWSKPQFNLETVFGLNVACGGFLFGIDIADWDNYLQHTLFPKLAAAGVKPTTFPIFVFYNVVLIQNGNPNDCCILGYHSAFSNPNFGNNFQTYAIADIDSTQLFHAKDVSALGHEVAEWLADPNGINPTPPWGHIGQVTGCQANLEVGDPLSPAASGGGPELPFTLSGFTYHVQDEAFTSWFYRQKPGTGYNGKYSMFGTFTKFAAACP